MSWKYQGNPEPAGDCRKLVTLVEAGMTWVGIRAFNHQRQIWMNNNKPEKARVHAWKDLDEPARGKWVRGKLLNAKDSDPPRDNWGGLLSPMPSPTLPEGNPEDD